MTKSKEELDKAKFFFDLALESDQIIQQANERLTEKIRSFFAVASTLIPIVIGLGYFILKETDFHWIFVPIFLSLIMFLLAIARGTLLHKPTDFKFVNPLKMINSHNEKSLRYVVEKSATTWSDTVDHNKKVINSKESGLNQMLIFIGIGLLILAISFLALGIIMWN